MKAILTYHSIDPSGSVLSVHPDRFREHVEILSARGVPVLALADLCAPDCERGIALTFDDGFENFADVAWPLIRDSGWPSTVFVASAWVGKENGWDRDDPRIPRLPLMDWPTLQDLAQQGVTLGSHTRTHPKLTQLGITEVGEEIRGCREDLIEHAGVEPETFAYPYGDFDRGVAEAVKAAGHRYAVTTELRALRPSEASALALPRLDAFYLAKPGVMEAWGTPGFHRYLTFRNAARRLRRTLARVGRST